MLKTKKNYISLYKENVLLQNNLFLSIKILLKIIILYFLLSFKNINEIKFHVIIEIDNKINETIYEDDLDFSNYSTKMKAIAIYFPQFVYFNTNDINYNEWKNVENAKPLYNNHKQPRNLNWKYKKIIKKNISKSEYIKLQINLAKNHGIYGFAINYYWFSGKKLFDEPLNIINNEFNFSFFIIWKNDKYEANYNDVNTNILIQQNFSIYDAKNFIKDIYNFFFNNITNKIILNYTIY